MERGRLSHRPATAKPKKRSKSNKKLPRGEQKQNPEVQDQQIEMPVYNEEYLNQLSEEELQGLLQQQQALM